MTPFVTPDGIRYAVARSGLGVPVLLLHGFTGRGDDWAPFRPALERLTQPVAVDLLAEASES